VRVRVVVLLYVNSDDSSKWVLIMVVKSLKQMKKKLPVVYYADKKCG
jgi:hypothetical protein